MGVRVIDKNTQQVVEVSSTEAQRGIAQGEYGVQPGSVRVAKGNNTGSVAAEDILGSLSNGWRIVDDEEASALTIKREESDMSSQALGLAEAGAAGLTLGLSSVGLEALGADPERMKARRDATGAFGTAAEIAGGLAGVIGTGGAGAAARGAGAVAGRGLAARALGAAAAPARAVARAGAAVERGVAGAVGAGRMGRVAAQTSRGAVEGYFAGAGAKLDENVLGKREQSAESIFIEGGVAGALFGGALGGALPIGLEAAAGAGKIPASAMRRVLGRATGAPGGEVGSLAAREVTAAKVPWRDAAADKIGELAEKAAPFADARPDAAGRAFRNAVKEPQRMTDLLSRRSQIEESAAELVGSKLNSVRSALDEGRVASQGASKYRRVAKTIPRNADKISPRVSEQLREGIDGRIDDMMRENADNFGRAYDVGALREAKKLSGRTFQQMMDNPKAVGAFQAMDTFKRDLVPLIERTGGFGGKPRFGATSDMIATNKELRSMYAQVKDHLEQSDLWGGGATVQKELNASYSKYANAASEFSNEASGSGLSRIFKKDGAVNTHEALRILRQYNKAGGAEVANKLDDVLESQLEHLRTINKHYEATPEFAAKLKSAEEGVAELRKAMKQQSKDAADLADFMELRNAESGGSVSIGIGSNLGTAGGALLGSAIGGPVGAAAGVAAGMVKRPYTAARSLASMLAMVDRVGGKRLGATGGMLERVAGPAAKRLKSAGDIAVSRAKHTIAPITYSATKERGDRVDRARQEAAVLATNPQELERRLLEQMRVVNDVAPGVAGEVGKVAHRASMFLAQNAPPTYASPFSGRPPLVEPAAADRYLRYVEAIESPMETLALLDNGTMTVDHAKALKAVYPELYASVQEDIMAALAEGQADGHAVPYRDLLQLAVVMEMPTTMSPSQMLIVQGSYGTMEQQEQDANPLRGGPSVDASQNDLTPTQRVESGEART